MIFRVFATSMLTLSHYLWNAMRLSSVAVLFLSFQSLSISVKSFRSSSKFRRKLTMSTDKVKFIAPDELAPVIKSGLKETKTVIVDVRDDDFPGGNVKGAKNFPSSKFGDDNNIDELIQTISDAENVVFYCGKSQQRGPFCAREYFRRLNEKGLGDRQNVNILEGGFTKWSSVYQGDDELIENDK